MTDAPTALRPFHLAFAVDDLSAADAFYHGVLGLAHGRRAARWIDYDFFGHQIVAHLAPGLAGENAINAVDGEKVPARHFGLVMRPADWRDLRARIEAAGVDYLIAPTVRFAGEPGEQGTFFVRDPAGNALEFKYFEDDAALFAR